LDARLVGYDTVILNGYDATGGAKGKCGAHEAEVWSQRARDKEQHRAFELSRAEGIPAVCPRGAPTGAGTQGQQIKLKPEETFESSAPSYRQTTGLRAQDFDQFLAFQRHLGAQASHTLSLSTNNGISEGDLLL
jgi:hypothetical protein